MESAAVISRRNTRSSMAFVSSNSQKEVSGNGPVPGRMCATADAELASKVYSDTRKLVSR